MFVIECPSVLALIVPQTFRIITYRGVYEWTVTGEGVGVGEGLKG